MLHYFNLKVQRKTRDERAYSAQLAHKRKLRRETQARWRSRHPVCAAWHQHKWNAKQKGHAVLWTFEEFAQFCFETGYAFLRSEGYEIDRIESSEGYCLSNCQILIHQDNATKGAFEKHYTSKYAAILTQKKKAS